MRIVYKITEFVFTTIMAMAMGILLLIPFFNYLLFRALVAHQLSFERKETMKDLKTRLNLK
jgi:multisubunit Na+/H+ antiporter MnhG subunit